MTLRTFIALATLATTGCTTTDSTGIATESLYVEYEAARHGDTVTAQATFHVGNGNTGTYVNLADGDTIRCNGTELAAQNSVAGQLWYEAELPATSSPYVFTLERASGNVETEVAAPMELTLTSPAPSAALPSDTPVTVTWSPGDGNSLIDISFDVTDGACASAVVAHAVADTGTASISLALPPDAGTCDGTLVVRRSVETPMGGPFQGGRGISSAYDAAEVIVGPQG